MVPDGTLLIHDSFSSVGVTAAIAAELLWSRRFRYVGRSRSLAVYRHDDEVRPVPNLLRQGLQLPWFIRNLGVKTLISLRVLRSIISITTLPGTFRRLTT